MWKDSLLEMKGRKELIIRGFLSSEFAFGSLRDVLSSFFFLGGGVKGSNLNKKSLSEPKANSEER